jgi:hypothetical protein
MRLQKRLMSAALISVVLLACGSVAMAANWLTNPGFESGTDGWTLFNNAFVVTETPGPPAVVACSGSGILKMYGNWSGPYNVSGAFQEFPSYEGDIWVMASVARWNTDDYLGGAFCGDVACYPNNFVVQKVVFFDAAHVEIPGTAVEAQIIHGGYAPDQCHQAPAITATAPAGTVYVQALILFVQPTDEGGAAFVDDVFFGLFDVPTESATWGAIKQLYE